jgi:hypothetical protein
MKLFENFFKYLAKPGRNSLGYKVGEFGLEDNDYKPI